MQNRYDFVLLFDVKDGNPNGDPDAGNLPRIDAETGRGLVTDVCLKRKVRNYIALAKGETPPFDIYVKEKAILTQQQEKAYIALGLDPKGEEGKRKGGDDVPRARQWMCQNFYDIRTFGAVMSLKEANCGQVRGPVQLTFGRSVDRIVALEHSITRMAVATQTEADKQLGDNRTMGRKYTVPYGLYVAHGFVSAHLANQTGFGEEDLALLWQSLINMFEHDRAAARGEMTTRGLYVFKHDSMLGNAPAHQLFKLIKPEAHTAVPREFDDYTIHVDQAAVPAGVELQTLLA
nr:type I-C CRISPR-associated protein Cas7/Csd2 [Chitinivorax tropicus]